MFSSARRPFLPPVPTFPRPPGALRCPVGVPRPRAAVAACVPGASSGARAPPLAPALPGIGEGGRSGLPPVCAILDTSKRAGCWSRSGLCSYTQGTMTPENRHCGWGGGKCVTTAVGTRIRCVEGAALRAGIALTSSSLGGAGSMGVSQG